MSSRLDFDITYQDACYPNNDQIETGESNPLPGFSELAPVHEEPHEATDSICEGYQLKVRKNVEIEEYSQVNQLPSSALCIKLVSFHPKVSS